MATLLNAGNANVAATSVSLESHSGPCTIWVRGVLDGATVTIVGTDTYDAATVVPIDSASTDIGIFKNRTGCVTFDAQGTYYLGAAVQNVGSSTSVTVVTTQ